MDGVLEQVGPVDTGRDPERDREERPPRPRRLARIREGQKLTGVCVGLAAYIELDVAWIRTFFIFATLFTAGLFGLVYVALVFLLPIEPSREARG